MPKRTDISSILFIGSGSIRVLMGLCFGLVLATCSAKDIDTPSQSSNATNASIATGLGLPDLPDQADWKTFNTLPQDEPIVAINLIRLHDEAHYAEANPDPDVVPGSTGRQAMHRYFRRAMDVVRREGGDVLFYEEVEQTLIGHNETDWDVVVTIYFPSRQAFYAAMSHPDYLPSLQHRQAGWADHSHYQISGRFAQSLIDSAASEDAYRRLLKLEDEDGVVR